MFNEAREFYAIQKRNKDGFTLIELIVVLMIIGVLVLLGVPRLAGYTQRAELRRIQHDVKVMEGKMDEAFNKNPGISDEWEENIKDLNLLVLADSLFEREGVAKSVAKVHTPERKARQAEAQTFSLLNDSENLLHPSDYKIVPEEFKHEIGTQLPGTFYVNKDGKVYYEHDKPLTATYEQEGCLAPTPESLDYEFDHKTGTIVKYHGNLQHLVIPAQFKVDEVCYPVLIIGRGAFAQGGFKSVVVPEGVVKIEEDAFNGNELEKIELPSTITEIGDNAFSGNGLTEEDDVTIRNDEGSVDLTDTGLEGSADFVGDDIIINTGGSGSGGSGGSGSSTPSSNPGGNGGTSGKQNGNIVSNGTITIDKENGVIKDYSGSDKNVTIPDKIIVDGEDVIIEEVEEAAYQGKGLITVKMPTGLKRIEEYAFAGNQLIAAWIPDSVEYVGNYAFAYNEVSNGRKTKSTIRNIEIRGIDYINDLDEDGNITKDVPGVKLMDHVFVNSNNKHVIDIESPMFDNDGVGFSYTGTVQEFVVPSSGTYKLEVWGAQGGGTYSNVEGGKGGYSSGNKRLKAGQVLDIYVGGQGSTSINRTSLGHAQGGWNGGGNGGKSGGNTAAAQVSGGGGGATDIRVDGKSLQHRVIVAGGGGGAAFWGQGGNDIVNGNGGAGGGLSGVVRNKLIRSVASQSNGYSLGRGQSSSITDVGGGGGGYYGGYSTTDNSLNGGWGGGAGGGSSYINGLQNAETIAGDQSMPNPEGDIMTGNTGHGYARIVRIK